MIYHKSIADAGGGTGELYRTKRRIEYAGKGIPPGWQLCCDLWPAPYRKDNADLADAAPRTPKTGVRRILRMLSTHKQEIRLGRTV